MRVLGLQEVQNSVVGDAVTRGAHSAPHCASVSCLVDATRFNITLTLDVILGPPSFPSTLIAGSNLGFVALAWWDQMLFCPEVKAFACPASRALVVDFIRNIRCGVKMTCSSGVLIVRVGVIFTNAAEPVCVDSCDSSKPCRKTYRCYTKTQSLKFVTSCLPADTK